MMNVIEKVVEEYRAQIDRERNEALERRLSRPLGREESLALLFEIDDLYGRAEPAAAV